MIDFCEHSYTDAISEEIMYFTMNVDENDIEGFAFRDYTQSLNAACDSLAINFQTADPACYHEYRANGSTWAAAQKLTGRPIGFDIRMGQGGF